MGRKGLALVVVTAVATGLGAFVAYDQFAGYSGNASHGIGSTHGGTVLGPEGDAFTFVYPAGWKLVSPPVISGKQSVLVALGTASGGAEVMVHRGGRVASLNRALVTSMDRSLRKAIPDYAFESADRIQLRHGGKALFFSYVRTRTKKLLTITLVPAGSRSYVIDTVSAVADDRAAADIGSILRSFRP